ncbi:MAG: hypothetical protein IPO88_20515 [Nannocystis sp.]|uniref:hypothetical protein n=1 Tax=Nannocystis sp. TaxID=1962667 RepID=UPI00242262A0|nr:hypothetical protein [Nannocystis sp.]MBK9755842.1 hypothetical protein [Nannocystis sp.]
MDTIAEGADAGAGRVRVKSIEALLSYSFTDWAITDAEAKEVLGLLGGVKGEEVKGAVTKLDRGPFMDRFISNLAPDDRWNNKKTFLYILSARSPAKNVPYVKELLRRGVFDWVVTDEEARLAFYLVKTMPKTVRDQFKEADGGEWWGRMEGNLDHETKTAKDATFYNAVEEVQKQKLEFEENAEMWSYGQLRMAIEMLVRMGEDDWVEKACQTKRFDKDEGHAWIFDELGFARSDAARDPTIWAAFKEKSAGQTFVEGMKAAGSGAKLLGKAIGGVVDVGVTGDTTMTVDMQDRQNALGGDVLGIRFAKSNDDKDNKVGLSYDHGKGLLTVNAPRLVIASIATCVDTTRIQTGPVTVSGVSIIAKGPTPHDPSQHYTLKIQDIEVRDLWQTSETAMIGAGSVSLRDLLVSAEVPGGDMVAKKEGLLKQVRLEQALFEQALSDIREAITRLVGMLDTRDPQPERIGTRVGEAFTGATDAKVSLGVLAVKDVVQSVGGYVGEVKVETLAMNLSEQRQGDAVRARLTALKAARRTRERRSATRSSPSGWS